MRGTVKWFDERKNFGFVEGNDGEGVCEDSVVGYCFGGGCAGEEGGVTVK